MCNDCEKLEKENEVLKKKIVLWKKKNQITEDMYHELKDMQS